MATGTSAPPASIGKYRIERELGRGASGIVYLGLDGFRGRKVAIKQTHAHLLKEPAQAERYRKLLRNEAALSGRLRHPHIVRLLDADEDALPPYLVLEYVDGQPLSAFAAPDTLLPVPQVLDIAFKCCNALDYACREGLVHRDIKPANLMLAKDGNIKLTDFGAALSLRSDATQLSGLVGSPSYMSPEQVREHDLTHHSDMFSLAVVVYELLTGRRPFDGDTDFATMSAFLLIPVSVRNHDIVMLGGLTRYAAMTLVSRPEIHNAKDLRGGVVGLQRPGDAYEKNARSALQHLKLNPDRDVKFLYLGTNEAMWIALEARKISATMVTPPATLFARKAGMNFLVNLSELKIEYQGSTFATRRSLMKNYPHLTLRTARAIVRGIHFFRKLLSSHIA